jgi:hypothetical protein
MGMQRKADEEGCGMRANVIRGSGARRYLVLAVATVSLAASPSAAPDVVVEWNAIMTSTVSGQNPFAEARFAAITQLAVFEAANAATGEYYPYLGTTTAPPGTSSEAAAVAAAHAVLVQYFPDRAPALDSARQASLDSIPDGTAKADGIAAGMAAAAAMIAGRANDGSTPPAFYPAGPPVPGAWQPTASCPAAGGVLRHWGNVVPFGIPSAAQFRSEPPPALASRAYAKDYDTVRTVGDRDSDLRPADRTDVARFYNAVLAVQVWNAVARQIAASHDETISQRARAFALLNMAISDGLVAVMDTKYHYALWRPETAIRAGDSDGNRSTIGDPSFVPLITAPCFPSYPSAHATASNAARAVLHKLYGNGGHAIRLESPSLPAIALDYTTFKQIADDIDDARVYGGIHFPFDQGAGAEQGRRIGLFVYRNKLCPIDGCE